MFSEYWHTRVGVYKIFIFNRTSYTSIFTIFKVRYVTHILYSNAWIQKLYLFINVRTFIHMEMKYGVGYFNKRPMGHIAHLRKQLISEEDFTNSANVFLKLRNLPNQKRVVPFIWRNMNSLHPMMHCVEFGWY